MELTFCRGVVWLVTLFLAGVVEAAQPIGSTNCASDCGVKSAFCRIDNGTINGVIKFKRRGSVTAPVHVTGEIRGLTEGLHGFHVHEFGDLSGGCASAGGHYNPYGNNHGAPSDDDRHIGDLGNIVAEAGGVAQVDITDYQLKLCGPHSILGRAIVVHSGVDDLGRGGNAESKKTGNAGSRVGCCVIGAARN